MYTYGEIFCSVQHISHTPYFNGNMTQKILTLPPNYTRYIAHTQSIINSYMVYSILLANGLPGFLDFPLLFFPIKYFIF